MDFPVVFLDEASMSTEPASLIPLMKGVSYPVVPRCPFGDEPFLVSARRAHW